MGGSGGILLAVAVAVAVGGGGGGRRPRLTVATKPAPPVTHTSVGMVQGTEESCKGFC